MLDRLVSEENKYECFPSSREWITEDDRDLESIEYRKTQFYAKYAFPLNALGLLDTGIWSVEGEHQILFVTSFSLIRSNETITVVYCG